MSSSILPPPIDDPSDVAAQITVSELDARIKRLEFHLSGSTNPAAVQHHASRASTEGSIASRLAEAERSFQAVLKRSAVLKDLLILHEKHPDLFRPTVPPTPPTLSSSEKLAVVLSSASQFQSTASALSSISHLPVPPPEKSAHLLNLLPRIAAVEEKQAKQQDEIAELRVRSARLLERWYLNCTEGCNERFADWDERIAELDRIMSRLIRIAKGENIEYYQY